MVFYDGISRGKAFLEIMDLINNVNPTDPKNMGVSWGLRMAMDVLAKLPAEAMWHDPGDERYPIPEGAIVNVEITQCRKQSVGRAWWTGEEWRTVGGVLPNEWVTGWQMLPKPREEKQHD